MRGLQVGSLVWEDPTCLGVTKPRSHSQWVCSRACLPVAVTEPGRLGACAPQQEKGRQGQHPRGREEQQPLLPPQEETGQWESPRGWEEQPCSLHNKRRDGNESACDDGKSSPASSTRGEMAMTAPSRMGRAAAPAPATRERLSLAMKTQSSQKLK